MRNLQERVSAIIESIREQDKLTPELEEALLHAKTLSEAEDLYRPYKPKRKTRASIAKSAGLEPLSLYIKAGKEIVPLEVKAQEFVNEEKGIHDVKEAIQGALDIIAEEIADNADYRAFIKRYIVAHGFFVSKEIQKDEKDTYAIYASYREAIRSIPTHRYLALNRGRKEECLKVTLD